MPTNQVENNGAKLGVAPLLLFSVHSDVYSLYTNNDLYLTI